MFFPSVLCYEVVRVVLAVKQNLIPGIDELAAEELYLAGVRFDSVTF